MNESLFSTEAAWNLSPSEYVRIFTSPLPQGNYATMVVSMVGHGTTTLFAGLKDTTMYKDGIQNVIDFFSEAMEAWAREVQMLLDDAQAVEWEQRRLAVGRNRGRKSNPKQVVVRAYLPGHEDCHDHRKPLTVYKPGRWGWYNWNSISDFNKAVQGRIKCKLFTPCSADRLSFRRCWTRASSPTSTSCPSTGRPFSGPTLTRRATVCTS